MTGSSRAPEAGAVLARMLDQVWPEQLATRPGAGVPGLGVAVSGGSDSLALLVLAADWAADRGVRLRAITVDHGLRPEAAQEAAGVARLCAGMGIAHDTLHWQGWDGRGNLQDAARRGRQDLMATWAQAQDLAAVALGHTLDDQAETVLMRLARGSGVDGLAAMAPIRRARGMVWLRPLLEVSRAALRAQLQARGLSWIEDPSNEDSRFARVRAREALAALAPLGIGAEGLAATARRMALARAALADQALVAARRITRVERGDVIFGHDALFDLPQETRERLVAGALVWVASAEYPPRRAALRRALDAVRAGCAATLHGCLLLCDCRAGQLRVAREHAAVAELQALPDAMWDGRWQLEPVRPQQPCDATVRIAALGPAGLQALRAQAAEGGAADAFGADIFAKSTNSEQRGALRRAVLALPAVWSGARLIAVPSLAVGGAHAGWRLARAPDAADFHTSILSH